MKKKVVIIGGGIAGLSAGIYAQRCGFDATILESHSSAGGNCTSWRRKAYVFEGGMHWLTGSDKGSQLNALWRYTGALDDSVAIHTDEPFIAYDHNGTSVCLYRDVKKTEAHLRELSPADTKEIKNLCNNIRKVQSLAMPVTDLRGLKVTNKNRPPLSMLFSAISAMRIIRSFSKISRDEYANRFSHEGMREMIRANTTERNGVFPIFLTMGTLASGDGGFPEGGSLPFVERMVKTFTDSGGLIHYNTRVERVVVDEGKAVGVVAKGQHLHADAVIVTADTMAIEHLFDQPLKSGWLDEMKAVTEPTMVTLISLGINASLESLNKYFVFKPEKPVTLAHRTYEYLSINNYAEDRTYSPEGKTALTIQLDGDTYDFWRKAREEGRYEDEKQRIADEVIAALATRIPEIEGRIEVCDVATPLTYERYCATWKGSWMTEMLPGMKMKTYPSVIKGLDGVYLAGHRMMPPGGLPVALMSGRTAVQYLCRDTDTLFASEE